VNLWNWAASSSVVGRGYLSGMMALFTTLKSTQILSPPDYSFATARLEIQGNAFTCSMMSPSSMLCNSVTLQRAREESGGCAVWCHSRIYSGLVGGNLEATHTDEQRRPLLLPGDGNGVNLQAHGV